MRDGSECKFLTPGKCIAETGALQKLVVAKRTRNAVATTRTSATARDVCCRAWLVAAVVRLHRALFDRAPTSTARVYSKTCA